MTRAGEDVIDTTEGRPECASMRCEDCKAWHHPLYHSKEPFPWGRRVRAHVAWLDTKRLARAWWKVICG